MPRYPNIQVGRQPITKGKLQVSYCYSQPSLYSSPYTDTDSDRFLSKPKTPKARASPDQSNFSSNDLNSQGWWTVFLCTCNCTIPFF